MEKTKGNMPAAMELLRKYVDLYQTDREAWEELAELYTQVCPGPLMAMETCEWEAALCMCLMHPAMHLHPCGAHTCMRACALGM